MNDGVTLREDSSLKGCRKAQVTNSRTVIRQIVNAKQLCTCLRSWFNPSSDLTKQHPVSHKDSLSRSVVWQETGCYKVNINFITSY